MPVFQPFFIYLQKTQNTPKCGAFRGAMCENNREKNCFGNLFFETEHFL